MEIKSATFSVLEEGDKKKFMVRSDKECNFTITFTNNQWDLFVSNISNDRFDDWVSGVEYKHEEEKYMFKILPPRGPDHGMIVLCVNDSIYRIGIDFQEINMLRSVIKRGIPKKTKLGFFGKEK